MQTISISKFKATCLEVLKRVQKTSQPVLITKFGKPIAEVVPPSQPDRPATWLGALTGSVAIHGDIVGPVAEDQDWDALRL